MKQILKDLTKGFGIGLGIAGASAVCNLAPKAYYGFKNLVKGALTKREEAPQVENPKPEEAAPKGDEQEPAK